MAYLIKTQVATTAPAARLHVFADSLGGAVLFSGNEGSTPAEGPGTRLMWIPEKAAFRAGEVTENQWNDEYIGQNSLALGKNATASAERSIAIGNNVAATTPGEVVIGNDGGTFRTYTPTTPEAKVFEWATPAIGTIIEIRNRAECNFYPGNSFNCQYSPQTAAANTNFFGNVQIRNLNGECTDCAGHLTVENSVQAGHISSHHDVRIKGHLLFSGNPDFPVSPAWYYITRAGAGMGMGYTTNMNAIENSAITISTSNYVGIGNTDPQAMFEVGNHTLTVSSQNKVGIGNIDPQYLFSAGTGIERFHITNEGRAGVNCVPNGAMRMCIQAANNDYTALYVHRDHPTSSNNFNIISDVFGTESEIGRAFPFAIRSGSTGTNPDIRFWVHGNGNMHTKGKVAIDPSGTHTPTEQLEVYGNAKIDGTLCAKEVRVRINSNTCPDYVFSPDYELMSLDSLKKFIKSNHHLPEIPAAQVVETNGMELGSFNIQLLKKVEELTLYILKQQNEIDKLKEQLNR